MANQLYKEHLLVWTAGYEKETNEWIPVVNISWRDKGQFQFHRLRGPAKSSEEDAMAEGLLLAKLWVDKKL